MTTTTTSADVLEAIDAIRAEHHPATQPLLRAMADGELTRDELRAFAAQYFHVVDSLPRFVSMVHSVTTKHPAIRRTLLNLLVPLELHPPSIADLWLQTCASLGLFSDTVRNAEPSVTTAVCLTDFEYLCQAGTVQGLAAIYSWLSRLPEVCRISQEAFATHYGIASGPGVQFFEIVGFQSAGQMRPLRAALAALLDEYPEAGPAAVEAARGATAAVTGMYSGVLAAVR